MQLFPSDFGEYLFNTVLLTVSQKNDTDVAHYNYNALQLMLVIFGKDVAEIVCYQIVICYPTSHN